MNRSAPWLWPLVVGSLVLAITGWLWDHEREAEERNLRGVFDAALTQTAARVEERIGAYEQMLRGARGLFEASDDVTAQDFAHYVDALLAGADFAGLRAIAFVPLKQAEAPAAPMAPQRGSAVDSGIARPVPTRADTAPITYVAPAIAAMRGEIGHDLLADPQQRAAMLQARDSGGTTITRQLAPGVDAVPAATVQLFLPLYANGLPRDSVASRRAALVGWVFANFRVADLMSSLYGASAPGLEVHLHDGVELLPETLMYSNLRASPATHPARFEAQEYIGFAGHAWTLSVRSTPTFERHFKNDSARIIGLAGCGLAVLLAVLTWLLATGRERANAAALAMTREVRDSTKRYQQIVETANEGIWTIDSDDRITFVNPKLAHMLGWPAEQLIGRRWTELVPEEERAAVAVHVGLPDASASPREAMQVRLQCKSGHFLWATLATSAVRDVQGHAVGSLAMVTDITERKEAEAKRTLLEDQLRQSQKMEAIGTLAGGIAHDFNNILAALLGNLALAQRDIGAEHPAAARLEQMAHAGSRARSLVQRIVAFSRQEPQVLLRQPIAPLLEDTLKLLRSTLPVQVELEARIADPALAIAADATQLQQVLMNLCTNAWHAMQGAPGRLVVGLEAVVLDEDAGAQLGGLAPGGYAHIWVSDTGCGMDEVTRSRVFEPFFTTKPVGQGTGLGLSVAHGIVTSHGGVINVTSELGRGSTFNMYFLATEPPAPSQPTHPDLEVPPRGAGQHVLYVDDDPVMLVMVEALLRGAGYRVTCACDAQDALRRVDAPGAPFAVVVTDFNMPEMSGIDLARELSRHHPDLPVVITTGFVSEGLRAEAQQIGVRHVLQKEYTLEQLPGLVHRVLAER